MTLKIEVSENDVSTMDEVMAKIAQAQGWENKGRLPDTEFLYNVVVEDGRCGSYDVVNDELELDDGETGFLFSEGCDAKWYSGESFVEFMDVSTAIWGKNEDGEYVLYME